MKALVLTSVLSLAAAAQAVAQVSVGPIERFGLEPFLARFYADRLDLTKEQRVFIDEQLKGAKLRYEGLNAELQREAARLSAIFEKPGAGEQEVLAQLDRVLDLERQIKRANVACSFRIRQRLTPAQIALLREVPVPPPPPPPPPPPGAARPKEPPRP